MRRRPQRPKSAGATARIRRVTATGKRTAAASISDRALRTRPSDSHFRRDAMATRERPLSPFMIGPYYRPQLTSVLSILHRGAGVVLAAGSLLVVAWLVALAFDADAYARLAAALASLPGKLALMLLVAA